MTAFILHIAAYVFFLFIKSNLKNKGIDTFLIYVCECVCVYIYIYIYIYTYI